MSQTYFELSGGLDSSSIVSYMNHLYPKTTFNTVSMRFKNLPQCDEGSYIDTVKDKYSLDMKEIDCDRLDYSSKYTLEYAYKQNPYWPILFTHTFAFAVMEDLKTHNIQTMITGQGGDQLLSGNLYLLYDYFKYMKWFKLYRELIRFKKPLHMIKRYIISPFLTEKQKKIIRFVYQMIFFKESKGREKDVYDKCFDEHSKGFSTRYMSQWGELDILTSSFHSLMLDSSAFHVIEKKSGIRYTHPFFDRRMIEFTLTLPAKFKYEHGVTKVLLRKVMHGILPERIRNRSNKSEFTAIIRQQIDAVSLNDLLDEAYLAKTGVIRQEKIDDLVREYQKGKMKTLAYFWMIINLEYWYRFNFIQSDENN